MTNEQARQIEEEAKRRGISVDAWFRSAMEHSRERATFVAEKLDYDPWDPNRPKTYGRDHY